MLNERKIRSSVLGPRRSRMSERWRKLFAAITLVLFVFTNGVLSAHSGMVGSQCQCAFDPTAVNLINDCDESVCSHCSANSASIPSYQGDSDVLEPQAQDPNTTPCDHDPCPCPDGCIYCSIAKVLGYTSAMPDLTFSFHVEQCVLESAPLYLPPISSRLIRPPRA